MIGNTPGRVFDNREPDASDLDCRTENTIEEVINEISNVAYSLIELYKEEDMPISLKLKSTTQKQPKEFMVSFPVIISSS